MSIKETAEDKIIHSLQEIKKIVTEHIKDVQVSIALMQSKIKPHEDFLDNIPTDQMDFYYGKSFTIRTLIDEIRTIQTNK